MNLENTLELVVTTAHERTIEASDQDVEQYIGEGKCGCQKGGSGQPCSVCLSTSDVTAYKLDMSELDRTELDLVVLVQLQSGMHSDNLLTNTRGATKPLVRQQSTYNYSFKGQSICREMFLFLHGISKERLYNLAHHLVANGVVPRIHGNTKRTPKHACSFIEIDRVH